MTPPSSLSKEIKQPSLPRVFGLAPPASQNTAASRRLQSPKAIECRDWRFGQCRRVGRLGSGASTSQSAAPRTLRGLPPSLAARVEAADVDKVPAAPPDDDSSGRLGNSEGAGGERLSNLGDTSHLCEDLHLPRRGHSVRQVSLKSLSPLHFRAVADCRPLFPSIESPALRTLTFAGYNRPAS